MRKIKNLLPALVTATFILSCGGEDSSANPTSMLNTPYDPQATAILEEIKTLPEEPLSDEEIYSLKYMWNEEKLAKDLYYKLAEAYSEYNVSRVFNNIASRSETVHQETVELLLDKYKISVDDVPYYEDRDLNIDYPPGVFSLPEIQDLYEQLLNQGMISLEDALKVGCIVEVTDVNDLNEEIENADNADIIKAFEFLRQGSYNHYWAFDRALKSIGVQDGCCSLGEEYCKTLEEYPPSNNANEGGNRNRRNRGSNR